MSEVVLQDQEILDLTSQVNEGEYVQLKITLPVTGRIVTSEKFRRSDMKGSTLIDWCEAIRGQMHADYQGNRDEMEAKRQQRIKEEEAAKEKAAQAAQEVSGEDISEMVENAIILPDVEQENASEDVPDIYVPRVFQGDGPSNPEEVNHLWERFGRLTGQLEHVKAQLRKLGEM